MKALTLHQPWATLVALDVKTIETRSWTTKHRGLIAIHAGAKRPADVWCDWRIDPEFPAHLAPLYDYGKCVDARESNDGEWWQYRWAGPLGAVVATANLVDCVPMVSIDDDAPAGPGLDIADKSLLLWDMSGTYPEPKDVTAQRPYGHFAPGRWAWLLEDIVPLAHPVQAKGKQGLWTWEAQ